MPETEATITDLPDVATGEWWVDVLASVKITVTDPEHIQRALTDEWRESFYTFLDVEEVLQHLAYNCAVNDVEDANRLDGWADLEPGQLTMHQDRLVEYERVLEPEPPSSGAGQQGTVRVADTAECHAGMDGDCMWPECPQTRDGEPEATGRDCPIADWDDPERRW